jgi:hypothetical protein
MVDRIRRLSADQPPLWGQMDAPTMLAHVADGLRAPVGDLEVRRVRGPLRFAPTRFLFIHLLPWPKGRARAPRIAFTTKSTGWEKDRAALLELMDRFATLPASELSTLHPVFGPMTERDWGVFSYRHLDHHLKQFRV